MLAIITGSGFYALDALSGATTDTVTTPYGDAVVTSGRWHDETPVLFLPRHGTDHSIAPHLINYRANIWALRERGASQIVATAVSGAIDPGFSVGDFVVIDDFIDFTTGRAHTFFDTPGELQHTEMGDPYDASLRAAISRAANALSLPVHEGGIYCATNGPRFETKAEIAMMKTVGGSLVGMTGCPEVILANELGLAYAAVGVISNAAAGLADDEFTVEQILAMLDATRPALERLIGAVIERIDP